MSSRHRRSYRLRGYSYALPNPYYITICTYKRQRLFGEIREGEVDLSAIGRIVDQEWKETEIKRPEVALDEYVIMPDHVHLILWIVSVDDSRMGMMHHGMDMMHHVHTLPDDPEINPITIDPNYVRQFGEPVPRSVSSIIGAFKAAVSRRVNREQPGTGQIWQPRFYDHVVRDVDDLIRIRQYIRDNPGRWVNDPWGDNA